MQRRDFLRRAPVALAAIGAPVAAATIAAPAENPALLALGEELPKVEQTYQDALTAWRTAWDFWSPQWPLAPEACCNKWGSTGYGRELERDLRGAGIRREGQSTCWTIKTTSEMENDIDRARELLAKDDKRKRSYGKRFRQYRHEEIADAELGLALLPGYLTEIEQIKRESDFEAIDKERHRATDAIFAFARIVLAEQSLTLEGVKIKARACAAINRLHPYDRKFGDMGAWKYETNITGLLGAAVLEVI